MRLLALLPLLAALSASAQPAPGSPAETAHAIPFAATDNVVEIALADEGARASLSVEVIDTPSWVVFATQSARAVAPDGGEPTGQLRFDVTPEAPVGEPGTIRVAAVDAKGRVLATREIRVRVDAPTAFEVARPRPNPVLAEARIPYVLPVEARVEASVYDLLGRRVLQLADETQAAGAHTLGVDARRLAAGVYVVRVTAQLGAETLSELRKITVAR